LKKGGKYFYTRNGSALIAFTVGKSMNLNNTCFKIIGTHTDSPNLRFAPNAYLQNNKFEKFNLQTYGGGLWQTWFDRDLSVAGKIIFRDSESKKLGTKLLRIDYPIMRIPHLAIHLSTDRNKFEWNNETHLKSILSTTFFDGKEDGVKTDKKEVTLVSEDEKSIQKKLGNKLANLIAKTLTIKTEQIIDYDLCLYDCQSSCLLGIDQEFVSSGRLDNLGSSLTCLHALINTLPDIEKQTSINFIALFDNEEVGSLSFQGADSEFFGKNLNRVFSTIEASDEEKSTEDSFLAACARSFVLSADMAHAYNPNYGEKYQPEHRPMIHGGVVIKINPQTRYATESEGSSILKEIGKRGDIPIQEFIVKQDSPCGTTIGPIIAGKLGIKTADIGIPQFAMHSIREMCGVVDLYHYRRFFEEFFKSYEDCVGDLIN
jgi:aspartyl aminopeptidase